MAWGAMQVAADAQCGWDSKRIHHALFKVFYEEDIYERLCTSVPWAMGALRWRINPQIRRRKLIFIHVPRAAGTSIAQALYGPRNTQHHSIRYYRAMDPRLCATAECFAVLRDPFDRFASAYAFVRAGGTDSCRLSAVFGAQTADIRSVDDYLCFLEERDILSQDFVMRPQSWFVCDLATGAPLVKSLFLYGEDNERLDAFLRGHGVRELPRLNAMPRVPLFLSRRQKSRIETLYARDFALVAELKAVRQAADLAEVAAIAAE
jgi:hypothetical protein